MQKDQHKLPSNPTGPLLLVEARLRMPDGMPEGAQRCAWISLGSGRGTRAFSSKRFRHRIITFLYSRKYIVEDEVSSLRKALDASTLENYSVEDEEAFFTEEGAFGDKEVFGSDLPPIYVM